MLFSNATVTEAPTLKVVNEFVEEHGPFSEILLCDDVTKEMDVYEVAFVVDFLRKWALKFNRIVIMAITPSSFEILLMFSKCALLTTGRIAYFDSTTKITQYFESIGFPCPKFKNPCDFYVDMVTYDPITQASAAESMERIEKVVQCWEQTRPSLQISSNFVFLPMLCKPSVVDILAAFSRNNYYEFLNKPLNSVSEPLAAVLMSVLIAVAFFSLTRDKRAAANDRIGFALSTSYFALIPWIFVAIQKVKNEKRIIHQHIRNSSTSLFLFLIFKLIWDLPLLSVTAALYTTPLPYFTAMNMPKDGKLLWTMSLYFENLVHLLLWRLISQSFAYLCRFETTAFFLTFTFFTISYLTSGIVVQSNAVESLVSYAQWLSPHAWILQTLLEAEFYGQSIMEVVAGVPSNNSELIIGCERKEVLAKNIKNNPILTLAPCSKMRGSQLLYFHGFTDTLVKENTLSPHFYFGCSILVSWILLAFLFLTCALWWFHINRLDKS